MIYNYKGFINSCNGKLAIKASEVDGLEIQEYKKNNYKHITRYSLVLKWHGGEDSICTFESLDQAIESLINVIDMIDKDDKTREKDENS